MRLAALRLVPLLFSAVAFAAPIQEPRRAPIAQEESAQPATASPLLALRAMGVKPATPFEQLGGAVSAAGDVDGDGYSDYLVASPGANSNTGSVLVIRGQAGGTGTLFQTLAGTGIGRFFGFSVAPAGDVDHDGYDDILIGEPGFNASQGRVFLYRGGPVSMTLDTTFLGVLGGASKFGSSVAGAGDVNGDGYDDIVVGAPYLNASVGQDGAAYVYLGGPGGIMGPRVVLPGSGFEQYRGYSVAGAGDMNGDGYDDVVVGAPVFGSPGNIYFYRGGPSGIQPAPADSIVGVSASFGQSVAPAGDFDGDGYADVAVGAPSAGTGGLAYLVHGAAGGIDHNFAILVTGSQSGEGVGFSVGCAGDVNGDGLGDVIVGVPTHDGPLGVDQGRAILFYGNRLSGGNANVIMEGNVSGSQFGASVSGIGDLGADGFGELLIGAPQENNNGNVYGFSGQPAAPARFVNSSWVPGNDVSAPDSHGGQSVSISGDFNGDGFDDCVWGAPRGTTTIPAEGVAYCMAGSSLFSFLNYVCVLHSGQANSRFGQSCSLAGDVNGDGYDDVLVGAPSYTSSFAQEGAAFLYLGGPAGPDTNAARTWLGGSAGLQWGSCVAGVGDLNRDGYADIAIASTEDATSGPRSGRVSVYLGGPSGPSLSSAFDLFGTSTNDSLGFAVAAAGDVNGDGYDDMIVGAPGFSSASGEFAIVYGGAAPPFNNVAFYDFLTPGSRIGWSVAGRGDLNGDGLADVAVGVPGYGTSGGAIFHLGDAGGLSPLYGQLNGPVTGSQFGTAVSWGDVNDDGFSDLVVGAPFEDVSATDTGTLYVYLGDGNGNFLLPGTALTKTQTTYGRRGTSISANGDINGDGFADIIDGAPYSLSMLGAIEQVAGGGATFVRERLERQRRADETAPISLGEATNATGDFDLHVRARTAAGRHALNVQYQTGTITQPWSSLPVLNAGVATTGPPDADGTYSDQTLGFGNRPAGSELKWRVRMHSRSPWFPYTPWLTPSGNAGTLTDLYVPAVAVGVDHVPTGTLFLAPVEPNPAQGSVTFSFRLAEAGTVELDIYDAAGRLVRVVDRGTHPAGLNTVTWDGSDAGGRRASSGIFFARLRVGAETISRRFVRL